MVFDGRGAERGIQEVKIRINQKTFNSRTIYMV
jgi:hypothetical protein